MVSVVFFARNAIGGFTPVDREDFDTYEEALEFYRENKAKYRERGIYLKITLRRYVEWVGNYSY